MLTIKQWMEAVNYRITEGSDYYPGGDTKAYCLDSWDGDHNGVNSTVVFDPSTQEVLHVGVYDYANNRAYRLANKSWYAEHGAVLDSTAWENVKYIDLDVDVDMLEKLTAIINYQPYDTRVQVELTLPDDAIFDLMQIAHRRDLTLNQLVEQMLREEIKRRGHQLPE